MGIRVTPLDNQPRLFEYYGIRVWVKYQHAAAKLQAKRMSIVSDMGMTEEEYGDKPESFRDQIFGRSFIDTIVTGIDPFELTETVIRENGEEEIVTISFEFNSPSSMDAYQTMGEELLGEDEELRRAILEHAVNAEYYRQDREAKTLGNSKAPSVSGGPSDQN